MNAPFPFVMTASTRQRVLDAIRWHYRVTGCAPSHSEIGKLARISPKRVHGYVDSLADAGYVTFRERVGRSILLIDRAAMLSDMELRLTCIGRGWTITESELAALADVFTIHNGREPDADLLSKLG